MDFDDSPEERELRRRAVEWLDANAARLEPAELERMRTHRARTEEDDAKLVEEGRDWQRRKAEAGWAAPHWPIEHGGRGLPPLLAGIFAQEERNYDEPGLLFSVGVGMAGPTIIEWGTDDQRDEHLAATLRADHIWCQLFSEPGAGSDLASLSTRAIRDGDEYVISGQKVWTSAAHYATHGLLLARTDVDVPKHRGITAFILDMTSPGIDVRPLRQIDGAIHFNEVFLDEVRVPAGNVLGGAGNGWAVAMTMLAHERSSIGGQAMFSFDQVLALARSTGDDSDPVTRQRLAELFTRFEILRFMGFRMRTAAARGEPPGPESSVMKLAVSELYSTGCDLMLELQGPGGTLTGDDAPHAGRFQDFFMGQWAPRLGGGTDEVQRNVVAERVLGLPGEPRTDKLVPFREMARSPT